MLGVPYGPKKFMKLLCGQRAALPCGQSGRQGKRSHGNSPEGFHVSADRSDHTLDLMIFPF